MYKPIIPSHVIAELENGAPEYVKENLRTIDYEEWTCSRTYLNVGKSPRVLEQVFQRKLFRN
jgi:hypothetical protein